MLMQLRLHLHDTWTHIQGTAEMQNLNMDK